MTSRAGANTAAPRRATASYEEWAELLCHHFFRSEKANQPVTFFVDDEILGGLEGSLDSQAGVASLRQAVLSRAAPDSWGRRFDRIADECTRWKVAGATGSPPSLPLLAVAVLAGTRMASEDGISSANYWKRFRQILDLNDKNDLKGANEVFPSLWEQLGWWLDTRHNGALGVSTIEDDQWRTVIGYALSQVLFRESDRQHLPELFQKIHLVPGEEIDPRELLQYFKAWAPRSPLTTGAKQMARDSRYDARLASILRDEAARFDGTLRDSSGRRVANLSVLYVSFPSPRYAIGAERPDTFPVGADFGGDGLDVHLTPLVEGWYAETWLLDPIWLRDGLRLESGDFVLSFRPSRVIPLARNRAFGCWSSVARVEPSEAHILLVESELAPDVERFLASHALDGHKREAAAFAPPGWVLFSNVVIEEAVTDTADGALAVLAPAIRERPTLRGGLVLDGALKLFLAGGEPDLWLPSLLSDDVIVTVDEKAIDAQPGARIPLRQLALEPGTHEVIVGASHLGFRTVQSLRAADAPGTGSVRHYFVRDGDRYDPVSLGATAASVEAQVSVSGAAVLGAAADLPLVKATLVLPNAAEEFVLVGAQCGDVTTVKKPGRPSWLDDVGGQKLYPIGFEIVPPFEVVWVVYETRRGRCVQLRTRLLPQVASEAGQDGVAAWQSVFAGPEPDLSADDRRLWDAYRAAARGDKAVRDEALQQARPMFVDTHDSTDDATDVELPAAIEEPEARDLLLHWASERGRGAWGDFREVHDWLFNAGKTEAQPVKATTSIHSLSMLGHLEIDWESGQWSAAPASLTILPFAGAHAVLAGSRTRRTAEEFARRAMREEVDLYLDVRRQEWGPATFFVAAASDKGVQALAQALEINYEVCVSERLAQLLPPLDDYLSLAKSTPAAQGYGVERFDQSWMSFRRCESDDSPGLYRYDTWGRPELRFFDGSTYFRVDRALGTYAELRRTSENVLRYQADSVNGTLLVPFRAQLPALHARVAVLCSGLMPPLDRDEWVWHYRNVPRDIAETIASTLGQQLK